MKVNSSLSHLLNGKRFPDRHGVNILDFVPAVLEGAVVSRVGRAPTHRTIFNARRFVA